MASTRAVLGGKPSLRAVVVCLSHATCTEPAVPRDLQTQKADDTGRKRGEEASGPSTVSGTEAGPPAEEPGAPAHSKPLFTTILLAGVCLLVSHRGPGQRTVYFPRLPPTVPGSPSPDAGALRSAGGGRCPGTVSREAKPDGPQAL